MYGRHITVVRVFQAENVSQRCLVANFQILSFEVRPRRFSLLRQSGGHGLEWFQSMLGGRSRTKFSCEKPSRKAISAVGRGV